MCLSLALQGRHMGKVLPLHVSSRENLPWYLPGYTGPSPDLPHWENKEPGSKDTWVPTLRDTEISQERIKGNLVTQLRLP